MDLTRSVSWFILQFDHSSYIFVGDEREVTVIYTRLQSLVLRQVLHQVILASSIERSGEEAAL